jgi:hypothetical protein
LPALAKAAVVLGGTLGLSWAATSVLPIGARRKARKQEQLAKPSYESEAN